MGDRLGIGKPAKNKISSDNARLLLGTIYFPEGDLEIDSGGKVADESAYTAVIANRIRLNCGPTLVLNSDFDKTTVPVPEGMVQGRPRLLN